MIASSIMVSKGRLSTVKLIDQQHKFTRQGSSKLNSTQIFFCFYFVPASESIELLQLESLVMTNICELKRCIIQKRVVVAYYLHLIKTFYSIIHSSPTICLHQLFSPSLQDKGVWMFVCVCASIWSERLAVWSLVTVVSPPHQSRPRTPLHYLVSLAADWLHLSPPVIITSSMAATGFIETDGGTLYAASDHQLMVCVSMLCVCVLSLLQLSHKVTHTHVC